jgi:DNA polymerase-4
MDAFYASVELLRYPQLKDLPVVIGGGRRAVQDALEALRANDLANADPNEPETPWDATAQRAALRRIPLTAFARLDSYTGRGVITTSTYAARQFGVGSAMGLMKAAKLCPQAILLPVDFEEYRKYSRQFKSIITEIAPLMEDRGVDEVYIDFTDVPGGQREGGRVLARLIQKSIFDATGLTCSVGVAPNKLLAKMASEFNKPRGIAIVVESDLETLIWPLACRKINGIGPKADEKLKSFGIETIGIKLRYDDFKSVTRDLTIGDYTADAKTIRHNAGLCLKRVPLQQRLRLLGVRVGTLMRLDEAKLSKTSKEHPDHDPTAMLFPDD